VKRRPYLFDKFFECFIAVDACCVVQRNVVWYLTAGKMECEQTIPRPIHARVQEIK
jgi:hypothetical protein